MKKTFYERTKFLDEAKKNLDPSIDEQEIVLSLIHEEMFSRYFFDKLTNPIWIKPLFENGIFFQFPNPIEVEPGSFQLPDWPAGKYLAQFTDQYEEIAIDVILSTNTENWRVQEILIDAMMKITSTKASELVYLIDGWLNGRFAGMLPIKLSALSNHLLESGQIAFRQGLQIPCL